MPAIFEQHGLRFEYPENWTVDRLEDGREGDQVIVSSPNTAFWHLSKHPPDVEMEVLFDEALAALRAEYPEMEVEAAQDQFEGRVLEGYNVNFICLDLTNTCLLRACKTPLATFLLICQAEDQEFDKVGLVFRAMLASALRNLT